VGVAGGAIATWNGITLSGGENTFSRNSASIDGGAIWSGGGYVTVIGGTSTFTENSAGNQGGAILAGGDVTLRATDGNFTFQGNKDGVGTASEKANAVHANGNVTLAAEEGRSIYFHDPVTTGTSADRTININNQSTDTGTVVFDGSGYSRSVDRFSEVYGDTTVGYGTLALQGNVTYGANETVGSFTLGQWASLDTDDTTNRIQAGQITMNGMVNIAPAGILELATAGGALFNGTLYTGLGMDFSGYLDVLGDLTFGQDAMMRLYWDDSTDLWYDGWSQEYSLFAAYDMYGLENLMLDMSAFDVYTGLTWDWTDSILTLSYGSGNTNNATPEPATLLILGLGAVGAGLASRRRK
jgi:predicted outer membrane repeat protein